MKKVLSFTLVITLVLFLSACKGADGLGTIDERHEHYEDPLLEENYHFSE